MICKTRMVKKFLILIVLLASTAMLFAQQEAAQAATSLSNPNANMIGVDTAKQYLKSVSVELFEREASWTAKISLDDGIASARLFDGGPTAKDPLPEGVPPETPDTRVLGVKVEFFRRGLISFYINAIRPIPIEGVTKTISVWVAGRNFNHNLLVVVKDVFGSTYEIPMGSLNFSGWKKMTAAVPPSIDGRRGIVQENFRTVDNAGISIIGFKVECDPLEAYGSYYIYFDDMRAVTDLYRFESRDKDDMVDSW